MIARITILLCLSLLMPTLQASVSEVSFFEGDLPSLKAQAKDLGKPYFIYLYEPENLNCQAMNLTWKHDELAFLVDRHYLAMQLDAQLEAQTYVQQFDLTQFPSLLFFSPEGQLLGIQEGPISARPLINLLEDLFFSMNHPLRSVYVRRSPPPSPGSSPPLLASLSQPPLSRGMSDPPEPARTPATTPAPAPATTPAPAQVQVQASVPGFEAYGLLDLPATELFALHLRQFEALAELDLAVQRYRRIWHGAIWVYARETDQQRTYHLLLGRYESEAAAEGYARSISKFEGRKPEILNLTTILE